MGSGRSRAIYPTQAKGRLEWGTQHLLPVWESLTRSIRRVLVLYQGTTLVGPYGLKKDWLKARTLQTVPFKSETSSARCKAMPFVWCPG